MLRCQTEGFHQNPAISELIEKDLMFLKWIEWVILIALKSIVLGIDDDNSLWKDQLPRAMWSRINTRCKISVNNYLWGGSAVCDLLK